MQQKRTIFQLLSLSLILLFLTISCNKSEAADKTGETEKAKSVKVTFIELGSVNCVPCRMMQPVMDKLEENFPNDVEVVFYDVWTEEEQFYAREYGIRVIPTQVFLDENGTEYYRNEGFFPYEKVVEVLEQKGVKN
jgi:thioredoxin 1